MPIILLPTVMAALSDAAVALGRISTYLLAEELGEPYVVKDESKYAVEITDGSFSWETAGSLESKKSGDAKKDKGEGKKGKVDKVDKKSLREKLFKMKKAPAPKKEEANDEKDILPSHSMTATPIPRAPTPASEDETPFSLQSISLRVPKNSFVAIVGRVGSGKSSLLNAMIGEMRKVKVDVILGGTVAYVPQQAWIMNASLRDNVLFGQDNDDERQVL